MTATMPLIAHDDLSANGVGTKLDEVRHALGGQAEHLVEATDRYTHEAGAHVADIADVATAQASRMARADWVSDLIKAAAAIASALALRSRKTAQDLGDDAQAKAGELRKLRLTTEPRKSGPDLIPGITLAAGLGAGIALAYFLDPENGRARRELVRAKLISWSSGARSTAMGTARDLSSRAQDAAQQTRQQIRGQMMPKGDDSLEPEIWSTSSPTSIDESTTDQLGEQAPQSLTGPTSN
jgi:hypothetical protein